MKRWVKLFPCILTLLIIIPTNSSYAQSSYNDVLVVVNSNSATSEQIGAYFASARNLPAANIVHVNVSTSEEIDSLQFNSLRSQIENHLTTNNLTNQINYIVTTKGVPLKVNRGNTFSTSSPSSSVESDLSLILGPYSSQIGKNSGVWSPYYYQNAHFSRAAYGVYLVTRLDGYSYEDVVALINRGGPNRPFSKSGSKFVFDQDPDWNGTLPGLNNEMFSANTILTNRGLGTQLDQTTTYLTNLSNVIGYVSWGSNDHYASLYTQYAKPNNSWMAGAIAETYVSTSGRTFTSPPTYGQSLISDLVSEGITGAKGYVYEPFSAAMALVSVLFDRYTNGYNLAESYYMASRLLSWMDVIVGDPKTSVYAIQGPLPIQLASFTVEMTRSGAELKWSTVSETNNYGFEIQRRPEGERDFTSLPNVFIPGHGTTLTPQAYSYVDVTIPAGTFYYRLKQIDLDGTIEYHPSGEGVKVVNDASFARSSLAKVFLAQNYPNPFNPSTTIQFVLPKSDRVVLKVYNTIGQEVATLVDGVEEAGVHTVKFEAGGLASGLYFYQIRTNDFSSTQKMLLIR
jgi:uncharacterized protein (TIGR03790 family)